MNSKYAEQIYKSDLISRDLSWISFNERVLEQAKKKSRTVFERLKFLAITASNTDEFFMIRVGNLYNYIDYGRERIDYCGLRSIPFKNKLLLSFQDLFEEQHRVFSEELLPLFDEHHLKIVRIGDLSDQELSQAKKYFRETVFPMLTPMVYDSFHAFPVLNNKVLIFGVVTKNAGPKEKKKMAFIQIPQNLPRFFEIKRENEVAFMPIEEVVRCQIHKLFRNVEILSSSLFRITRNGDFDIDELDDIEYNFLDEMKQKLRTRKTGRITKLEIEGNFDKWLLKHLIDKFEIEPLNVFKARNPALIDYTRLWQIVGHKDFQEFIPESKEPVKAISLFDYPEKDLWTVLRQRDVLLHHPYNTIEPLLELLDMAAEDTKVLSIKLTIYRLAKNSRITAALLKAAENGKHIAVLFEVKARFDEENNMIEAQKLEKAGCFVVYGVGSLKTHTKLLQIVRKEGSVIRRYVHMSSGNYNESTARLYTDLGILTTDNTIANDVSEFFNAITGHSFPEKYDNLVTAPREMKNTLIALINRELANKKEKKPAAVVIKVNSFQDRDIIEALYEASKAGVQVDLIVRGICCLRPGREGLSDNIRVRSIVGDYLEHSRIYYFHNAGVPEVYSGSADVMVRSFERRIESLFKVTDNLLRQQIINILAYNLRDNMNTFEMNEDGTYSMISPAENETPFNIHEEFYQISKDAVLDVKLADYQPAS